MIKSTKFKHVMLAFAATVSVGSAFAGVAQARRSAASLGTSVVAADRSCFRMSGGAMRNDCNADKRFSIPLVIDTPATHNVQVFTTGAATCFVETFDAWGTQVFASPSQSSAGGNKQMNFNAVPVGNGISLNATCTLKPGAKVNAVNWDDTL